MRGAGGLLCVAVAALLMCCGADPRQESAAEDGTGYSELREKYGDIMQLLKNHQSSLETPNINELDKPMVRRSNNFDFGRPYGLAARNLGFSNEYQQRNSYRAGANGYLDYIRGSPLMVRVLPYEDGLASVGNEDVNGRLENFVRDRETDRGTHFLRNLDPLGGGNLVKKNLDHIGGPNLIKKTLDSLVRGNPLLGSDFIAKGRYARIVDPIGGGHLV